MVRVSNPLVFAGEVYFQTGVAEKVPAKSFKDFPGKSVADIGYATVGLIFKDMPEPAAPRKVVVNKKGGDVSADKE